MNIAIFASGSGTNAENLMQYFSHHEFLHVRTVVTNNPQAGVIARAHHFHIPVGIFSKAQFADGTVLHYLKEHNTGIVVLAGFLLLVPENILQVYKDRIINIHPALLPAHGGKGFYGSRVHEAVIGSKAIMSGITIHHVNDKYDDGEIIFQAACHIAKDESAESLAQKIHELEYRYFPVVIEKWAMNFVMGRL